MLDADRLAADLWRALYPRRAWVDLDAEQRAAWVTRCMRLDERAHVAALLRDLDAYGQ